MARIREPTTGLFEMPRCLLAVVGARTGLNTLPAAVGAVIGRVVLGIALGAGVPRLLRRLVDLPTAVIGQFTSTFAANHPPILSESLPRQCVATIY